MARLVWELAARAWGRLPVRLRQLVMRHVPPGRFRVGVLAVVVGSTGEVLLLRHRFRGSKPWGLPGGWLEPGESPLEGMRRELGEELGIDVQAGQLELVAAVSRPGRPHVEIFYRLERDVGALEPNVEFDAHRAFPPGDLPEGMLEFHRRIVEELAGKRS